ncbi:MAG: hypothetical protein IKP47_04120 [Ruminococcus sp.]|nr:hypothetical protein [Ruminococcus sp.]
MLIKYSVRSFRRYLIMDLLTVLQLAAVLTMIAFSVSAVSLRLSRYTPFKDEFTENGRLALIGSFAHDGDLSGSFSMINTSEEMSAYLGTDVKALGIHMCDAYIADRNDIVIRSADDELIERYAPMLTEGDWFGEGLCAAVTENSEYYTGDKLTADYYTADGTKKTLELTVTAVIKNDAKLAGFSGDNDGSYKDTFELFYRSADEQDGKAVILLRESALPEDMVRAYTGTLLLNYPGDDDEQLISERLSECGANYSLPMPDLDRTSRRYLSEQLYELLPLIVILCIMALVGSISTSALSTREQLRDYSVFTLCGLRKNGCILIGLIQSVFSLLLAGVISAIACAALTFISPGRFYLEPDLLMLLGESIIAVLFIVVSVSVPALMISRSSVKELLDTD